ncbi:guanine nucleotide exchange factor C9orf72 homolog isoform X3 [Hemiscyllium ocellatum]|uniref:guanine nucleotide exchange factor C9orf72 homolog isoform X3 n=1 Tax=Hemiscyllium ocellatum TaxID=170820 RepID=UPI002966FC33|nr:guanine nucleotide exchange factor C9orf72 homolog isoform X3 [Hemiscyllium ocellatum]
MSSACPPQSPAVAKTEIPLDSGSPLLAATFAYWDNILGPRVRHIWAPKSEQLLLSDGEITFLANHTLNGTKHYIFLNNRDHTCHGIIFIHENIWRSRRSSTLMNILPHHLMIKDTLLNDDDIGDSCREDFLHKAISSHLQTCGCSVVIGSNPEKVNKMVRTLCLFLTPNERKCARLANASGSFKYDSGLFVQGLLKDATGSFVLPFRQIMYAPYPTTHIDVDVNTVKQMAPCHEHIYNQQSYMSQELHKLQKTASEEDVIPDTVIHMDESFTPDLNIFQDMMYRDTLVKSFLDQIFQLKSGLSLRSIFLSQFLLVLHRKAQTVIKYIEDETQKGKKPFKSLRNLKTDLDLAVEGDLAIIMAIAEKLKPGLHSFIFGKSFYTSVQERDVLMSL